MGARVQSLTVGGTEGTVEAAAGSPRRDTDAPQAIIITISINTIITITISRGRKGEEEEKKRRNRVRRGEQWKNKCQMRRVAACEDGKDRRVNETRCLVKGGTPHSHTRTLTPLPSAMPLLFRTLLFAFVTLLVVVLIIDDIAQVEEEAA